MEIKESVCACSTCKSMCKRQPCIGTPEDIVKIIQAGHSSKLAFTVWGVGLATKTYDKPIEMIQPLQLDNGYCAFLDENELCSLHEAGLKPTEGKLAHHSLGIYYGNFKETPPFKVAMTWVDDKGENNPTKQLIRAANKLSTK